jgi:CubicO group peptidase (beta-lactamase class C family)
LEDVATYIGFLTGAGARDPRVKQRYDSVLKRSSLQEMWQPRVSRDEDGKSSGGATEQIGLAFFLTEYGGHHLVGHTGGQNGFATFFDCDPVSGVGVIGAINTGNGVRDPDARSAFTILHAEALKVFE